MNEKIMTTNLRGIFCHIILTEFPSDSFLEVYDGFLFDVALEPENEGIRIIMFNVSDSDLEMVKTVLSELKEEGFTTREESDNAQ